MGYESKLYIVEKSDVGTREDGMKWAEVIATFDLCKVPDIDFRKYPPTKHYIYEGDDDIIKDCYGEPLRELTVGEAITEIELAMEDVPNYRRWLPCLGLLKGFNEAEWNSLAVLHFGH